MNELALFAGCGGGLLASKLLGWDTVCACEINTYCQRSLLARQADGALERFPIWDDVTTFDGKLWRGKIDVISGGFPCQDISSAGTGGGLAGSRSGLWFEYERIIGEVRPSFVFAENSPNLRTRGLATIVRGLASMGYAARWCVLGARHVGANHRRDRMWIVAWDTDRINVSTERRVQSGPSPFTGGVCGDVADSDSMRQLQQEGRERNQRRWAGNGCETDGAVSNTTGIRSQGSRQSLNTCDSTQGREGEAVELIDGGIGSFWGTEPRLGRVAHGVAHRMDRLKAIGNGQVSQVAALAWRTLTSDLEILE